MRCGELVGGGAVGRDRAPLVSGQEPRDVAAHHAMARRHRRDVAVTAATVLWSAAMLVFAIASGTRHDYLLYLDMWDLVRDGQDPWAGDNTYGPLFNVLAPLAEPTTVGPKVAMVLAFLVVNLLLVRALLRTDPSNATLAAYAILVPANALVIGVVAWFGQNDALTAALIGAAVLARLRRRVLWAGVFLGLATLYKYYPALLVPFFCFDRRRFDLRMLATAATTTVVGSLLAVAAWGGGFVSSLGEGASRRPKLLSILASWDLHPHLYGDSRVADTLIRANAAFVLLAVVVAFAAAWMTRLSWIEGAFVASLGYLLVYKVGHQQFWVSVLVLAVGLLVVDTGRSRWLACCFLPFAMALSVFELGYAWLTDGYSHQAGWVRHEAGFLAFALGCATIVAFFLGAAWRPDTLGRDGPPGPEGPVVGAAGASRERVAGTTGR